MFEADMVRTYIQDTLRCAGAGQLPSCISHTKTRNIISFLPLSRVQHLHVSFSRCTFSCRGNHSVLLKAEHGALGALPSSFPSWLPKPSRFEAQAEREKRHSSEIWSTACGCSLLPHTHFEWCPSLSLTAICLKCGLGLEQLESLERNNRRTYPDVVQLFEETGEKPSFYAPTAKIIVEGASL